MRRGAIAPLLPGRAGFCSRIAAATNCWQRSVWRLGDNASRTGRHPSIQTKIGDDHNEKLQAIGVKNTVKQERPKFDRPKSSASECLHNWNIDDPATRALKVAKLHEIVRIAAARDLPLNAGTEMNAPGNKLVDDFEVPEMAPVKQAFLDGAHFIYGHTVMQRALGLGYQSEWAQAHLPARRERNDFYTTVGYRVPPGAAELAKLRELAPIRSRGDLLARM
jgi:hypothetical protein